jgi:tripartite-type tricarboxylate transporter receptor subunit TctC
MLVKTARRTLSVAVAAMVSLLLQPASSNAQAPWPQKPVTVIVPFGAGGNTDVLARIFAERMSAKFGQQFVIENRAGQGGSLGIAQMVKAPPDGYTLGVGTGSGLAINPHVYKDKLGYDSLKDLVPLKLMATQPNFLVTHPSIPAKTLPELVAFLKANPDKESYGSSGVGSSQHLCMEMLIAATGVKVAHVPYRASNQIMQDLISGQIKMSCDNFSTAVEQVRAKNVIPIAVTSVERYPIAPEFATMAETLPGFDVTAWFAWIAPVGVPKEITDKVTAALSEIGNDPEINKRLLELGVTSSKLAGAEFATFLRADHGKWKGVIEAAGIKAP